VPLHSFPFYAAQSCKLLGKQQQQQQCLNKLLSAVPCALPCQPVRVDSRGSCGASTQGLVKLPTVPVLSWSSRTFFSCSAVGRKFGSRFSSNCKTALVHTGTCCFVIAVKAVHNACHSKA
jgi:hypothetical protein